MLFLPLLATISFIGQDLTTQGSWHGHYGTDGQVIAGVSTTMPKYATVATGAPIQTWATSTSATPALQNGTTRTAKSWYGNQIGININITDGRTHQVAIYIVDFDNSNRIETINGISFSSFQNGVWLLAQVSGNVSLTIISTGTPNAVVSGLFFDPLPSSVKYPPTQVQIGLQGPPGPTGPPGPGSSLITPPATTIGNLPQWGDLVGGTLTTGLGFVTTVGSPGSDTNVASEKGIRTALAAFQPLLSFTGNGSKTVSATAAGTNGHCAQWAASGNLGDSGSACGSGGGSSAWSALTSGTNTTGAFLIGSGATLGVTGSGTIGATSVPVAGVSGLTFSNPANTKAMSNFGTLVSGHCGAFDSSGNLIDAGAPCFTTAWSSLTSGTNSTGAFLIGTGSSIGVTGSGTITATAAAKWTTARNLAGNSVDGSANVAFANKFIVQGTSDAGLSTAQFLGALGTGIVKNTTATGVLSIAVAGDFPTLNQNTSGNAATATALASTPTLCSTGFAPTGILANGNATACAAISGSGFAPSPAISANTLLIADSTGATYGFGTAGPSGAVCIGTSCSGGTSGTIDIVTSIVPRLAAANTFNGVQMMQQLRITATTYAGLPVACSSGMDGQVAYITDSTTQTWGATVTVGGGSLRAALWCDGSVPGWTIFAK